MRPRQIAACLPQIGLIRIHAFAGIRLRVIHGVDARPARVQPAAAGLATDGTGSPVACRTDNSNRHRPIFGAYPAIWPGEHRIACLLTR